MKKVSFLLTVLFTLALTACVHKTLITPSQSRVGYSAWNTQVSYTHCDPLPKTGKPESVRGTWEVNDGILQSLPTTTPSSVPPEKIVGLMVSSSCLTTWMRSTIVS